MCVRPFWYLFSCVLSCVCTLYMYVMSIAICSGMSLFYLYDFAFYWGHPVGDERNKYKNKIQIYFLASFLLSASLQRYW